jgi:hypothetical protein
MNPAAFPPHNSTPSLYTLTCRHRLCLEDVNNSPAYVADLLSLSTFILIAVAHGSSQSLQANDMIVPSRRMTILFYTHYPVHHYKIITYHRR